MERCHTTRVTLIDIVVFQREVQRLDIIVFGRSKYMLGLMNRHRTLRFLQLLLKLGGVAIGFVFALLGTAQELFASVDSEQDDERQLHDSDLSGELNHRTGRLDSGTDPYGWYDRE